MIHKPFAIALFSLFIICSPLFGQSSKQSPALKTKSVFKLDTSFPTSDKPQSKLWYSDNFWWALLPGSSGPSLWQRTDGGWKEHLNINAALTGVPGRADVWANDREVTAVGVDPHYLSVFRLNKVVRNSEIKWEPEKLADLRPPFEADEIETATIGQDKAGHWWVAADAGLKIYVWNSIDGKKWTQPYLLAEGIGKDDICTISVLPDRVGVIWSDQVKDAVQIREHLNSSPSTRWGAAIAIAAGNKTADDHLHTALTSDGTLYVATKNSVDQEGKAQLVMRVRSPKGKWSDFPYAVLTKERGPSRPVVIATENPGILLAGHTIYTHKNSFLGEIVFGKVDTSKPELLIRETAVISPDTTGWIKRNLINDITGPKKPFPGNAPWIVLASDREGRVYEADLRPLFKGN